MSETVTPPPEATTPEAPKPTPPVQKTSKEDDLPDWARQQISSANADAAKYRVQFREADTARQTLQEQVASLTAEKTQAVNASASIQTDFDKLVTAIQANVPNEHVFAFAKTLQGNTAEELTAHAEALKSMFSLSQAASPAYDRSQGQSGDQLATDVGSAFGAFMNSQLTK
ncbi:hypothetical protein [Mycobacteroides abscessus]|uniref:hypothetical protein n=1 Tax=Mycobacteroides abscessus TaxID=36809 RepID=UPI000C25913E|nr:hypothetical protein [Mycobacteroides abscessus]MDB2192100.1 hypothetical protein [Mycobacteroides abscessus subsp. abscessus]WJJ56686.1 scaffolding protein [Mycobacterium phage prophiBWHA-1]